ncbi:C-GCAxxG-C-C family protein [Endozoicomonas euniceicola]|uniref:C-GCAxxG-C-C family protein n=1 Tax=Endozoicomonas euniceicola TaxID=1234143 RepID=A0ABY6H1Q4_9GAMM|nr:C-GCAxxG-C-C family protein [Endozoicomonas euniceicola]UYM18163.1 C-GCAxxG-C-C family protein [Endozoicomonas euniceicola]
MPIPKRHQPNSHLPPKEQAAENRRAEQYRSYSEVSEQTRIRAEKLYRDGKFFCSEAVFTTVNDYLGQPADSKMVKMASGFAVGIGMAGCLCGALSGGVMALGLRHGREKGGQLMPEEMFPLSAELHDRFQRRNCSTCCRKLIKKMEFGSKEHKEQCIRFTGEVAADVIDLLENGVTQPQAPGRNEDCQRCDS